MARNSKPSAAESRRAKVIAAMSEEDLAGRPDQKNPRCLGITIGEAEPDLTVFMSVPVEADADGNIVQALTMTEGGVRILVPEKMTRAEAVAALTQAAKEIGRYWGGMCLDPDMLWPIVYDCKVEACGGKEEAARAAIDDDPGTWPVERLEAAADAAKVAAFFALVESPPDRQRLQLERWQPEATTDALHALRWFLTKAAGQERKTALPDQATKLRAVARGKDGAP